MGCYTLAVLFDFLLPASYPVKNHSIMIRPIALGVLRLFFIWSSLLYNYVFLYPNSSLLVFFVSVSSHQNMFSLSRPNLQEFFLQYLQIRVTRSSMDWNA